MRNSELDAIAARMMTPEFVTRLYDARRAMIRSPEDYDERRLAQDLDVPLPIGRILLNFVGAIMAEQTMTEIVARAPSEPSEARH